MKMFQPQVLLFRKSLHAHRPLRKQQNFSLIKNSAALTQSL
jgi:hypothetical protein